MFSLTIGIPLKSINGGLLPRELEMDHYQQGSGQNSTSELI